MYRPDNYHTEAATKLASSHVAPLIAAARGYTTATTENLPTLAPTLGIPKLSTREGRLLKAATKPGPALIMPWYRIDNVATKAHGTIPTLTPDSYQARPHTPIVLTKKPAKYLTITGNTVLDIHPTTPWHHIENAPTIILVEGLLKADSALTAYLTAHGATPEDLTNTDNPHTTLTRLYDAVPPEQRALIIAFVGVGNWRQNPEWASLRIRDRNSWVAFDADTATNPNVWNQAEQLERFLDAKQGKHGTGTVQFLDLTRTHGPKTGIDDYLADGGKWNDLPAMLTTLPDRPDNTDAGIGTVRMNPTATALEEKTAITNPEGLTIGSTWKEIFPFGGWVEAVETVRTPTDWEVYNGQISHTYDPDASVNTVIVVRWDDPLNPERVIQTNVTGPSDLLVVPPKDWWRVKDAHLPIELKAAPHFPPLEKAGYLWLDALKTHKYAERKKTIRWEAMGYLPTETHMSFVAGNTIITPQGIEPDPGIIGVTDTLLSGASLFGMIPPDNLDQWEEEAATALIEILDTYILSEAWTDPRVAATMLAVPLRPIIPAPSNSLVYYVGPPRGGKSFSASMAMSFWQAQPGTWSESRLPGSAKDTLAATEVAVSVTPIWVADDLAPSADRVQAAREEAAMQNLMRNIHNRASKRRSTATGGTRKQYQPRAVTIITAENQTSGHSANDRAVEVWFGKGTLHPSRKVTDQLVKIRDHTGTAARLAWLFTYWHLTCAHQAGKDGWKNLTATVKAEIMSAEKYAHEAITLEGSHGDATRHAKMAADLMVVYERLRQFARYLKIDTTHPDHYKLLTPAGLAHQVALQVARTHTAQKDTTAGQSLLTAVRATLTSGKTHLTSLEDPTRPPFDTHPDADRLNSLIGWKTRSGQNPTPSSTEIGWLLEPRTPGGPHIVLLEPTTAFAEAKRHYPELVPPGSTKRTGWSAVWEEGLAVPPEEGWSRKRDYANKPTYVVRIKAGTTRVTGVPLYFDALMDTGLE